MGELRHVVESRLYKFVSLYWRALAALHLLRPRAAVPPVSDSQPGTVQPLPETSVTLDTQAPLTHELVEAPQPEPDREVPPPSEAAAPRPPPEPQSEAEKFLAGLAETIGRSPSVLDWNSGVRLREALPGYAVFDARRW